MNKSIAVATLALSSAALSQSTIAANSEVQPFNLNTLSFSANGEVLVNGHSADLLLPDVLERRKSRVKNKGCINNSCAIK